MDPQQETELDALIAAVDGEDRDAAASPAEAETADQEIDEPDGQPEGDAGDANEAPVDDEDGAEPEEDESYEVNVADLTPVSTEMIDAWRETPLSEVAALRAQVNELQGFQTQYQQAAEQAEFRGFLESLKGMDPDEAKDAVSIRVANSYIALQKQVADRNAQDQMTAAQAFEAQQREKAIQFIAQGGRRIDGPNGARYVANPKLVLTEREAKKIRLAAENGMNPIGLEQMAAEFVEDRRLAAAEKRSTKQQTDSKNGATRTLAGAGAAKREPKQYGSGEEALDSFLDDLLG